MSSNIWAELSNTGSISTVPVLRLFVGMLVWAFLQKKSHLEFHGALPLDDEAKTLRAKLNSP